MRKIIKALQEMVTEFLYTLTNIVKKDGYIILDFILPYLCMFLYEAKIPIWLLITTPLAILFLKYLFIYISRISVEELFDPFPVARKRFTWKDQNGTTFINTEELTEVITYLSEVEDYCEYRGFYKKK